MAENNAELMCLEWLLGWMAHTHVLCALGHGPSHSICCSGVPPPVPADHPPEIEAVNVRGESIEQLAAKADAHGARPGDRRGRTSERGRLWGARRALEQFLPHPVPLTRF